MANFPSKMEGAMVTTIEEWLWQAVQLQKKVVGVDPQELEGEERMQYVRDQTLAAADELHEMLAETDWKPWKQGTEIDTERFTEEAVDLLHFIANLFLVARIDPRDFVVKYAAKIEENYNRQRSGY